jgi:hydrogenase nickel incorporation protein HypA/HybF
VHELSLTQTLIEQVEKEVQRSGAKGRVTRVALVIGRRSGVNSDAMRFAFQMLVPGTLLEAARVHISEPNATCRCRACDARTEISELVVHCPACGSDDVFIEGGRDLVLQSIDVED